MNFVANVKTFLGNPYVAQNYLNFIQSKLYNSGQAVRILFDDIRVTGFSGFSEFHSCQSFLSSQERDFFQTHTLETGDLIDVGANLGVISLFLAQQFPTRLVHAFEANPSTFNALQQNIVLNKLNNISSQNIAIAGHDGEIIFNANPVYRGTTSITKALDQHTISIPCITLDTYVEQQSIQKVALLKVDVEGYETLVFEGAKELLVQRKIQVIYYEVCPEMAKKAGFLPATPTEILLNHGYRIYRLNSGGILTSVEIDAIEQVDCENWIALCP